MKRRTATIAATALLAVTSLNTAVADQPHWYIHFYEHTGANGRMQDMQPVNDGFQAIPVDVFDVGLQNHIEEVRFNLPKGAVIEIYSDRFWKNKADFQACISFPGQGPFGLGISCPDGGSPHIGAGQSYIIQSNGGDEVRVLPPEWRHQVESAKLRHG